MLASCWNIVHDRSPSTNDIISDSSRFVVHPSILSVSSPRAAPPSRYIISPDQISCCCWKHVSNSFYLLSRKLQKHLIAPFLFCFFFFKGIPLINSVLMMHYQKDYKKIYFLENLERIDHIESLFLTPGNLIRA
jgi:hypothetical protein